jgi:hypothetical protein
MDLSSPLSPAARQVVFGEPCPRHLNEPAFDRPYRKQYALVLADGGSVLGMAKIAEDSDGDALIAREVRWLQELAAMRALRGQVPRLLECGTLADGRRYLVTTVSPVASTTNEFTSAHARFLARLGKARFRASDFELSSCCKLLRRSLRGLATRAASEELALLQQAYRECEAALLYWTGPYVIAQGDFVPWNVSASGERLFVFDWEQAHAQASPLEDVLHFLLAPRALGRSRLSMRALHGAMKQAQAFALQAYPEWSWRAPALGALTLVYLVGAVVRSALESGTIERAHRLTGSYLRLIEKRRAWMPA